MTKNVDSFDDIVFELRNKDYGAYELRKKYSKRGSVALFVSLIVLFVAVGVPLLASIMKQKNYDEYIEKNVSSELTEIKEIEKDELPPPPPPPPPPAVKEVKFTAPKIVDSLTTEEVELATVDDLSDAANTAPVDTAEEVVEFVEVEQEVIVEQVFESFQIQEQPAFPGGESAMMGYIVENIQYPQEALENDIQGTVYIRFVVTRSGAVGEAQVLRSVHELLDKEALRVVKSLPNWTPGKQNGTPVSVWFVMPIKFTLQ
jgi:protein TonB